jgi:hypothetical protein
MWQAMVKVHIDPYMDFCELNDKAIKGLTCLSKIVSKIYTFMSYCWHVSENEYYVARIEEDKRLCDSNAKC